jgi:hypothetical protein
VAQLFLFVHDLTADGPHVGGGAVLKHAEEPLHQGGIHGQGLWCQRTAGSDTIIIKNFKRQRIFRFGGTSSHAKGGEFAGGVHATPCFEAEAAGSRV